MVSVALAVGQEGSAHWERVLVLEIQGWGVGQGLGVRKVHLEEKNIAGWMLALCPWPHRHREQRLNICTRSR